MALRSIAAIQCGHLVAHTAATAASHAFSTNILLCGACSHDLYTERAAAVAAYKPMSESPKDYKPEARTRAFNICRAAILRVADYENSLAMLNEAHQAWRNTGVAYTSSDGQPRARKQVRFVEGAVIAGMSASYVCALVDGLQKARDARQAEATASVQETAADEICTARYVQIAGHVHTARQVHISNQRHTVGQVQTANQFLAARARTAGQE